MKLLIFALLLSSTLFSAFANAIDNTIRILGVRAGNVSTSFSEDQLNEYHLVPQRKLQGK